MKNTLFDKLAEYSRSSFYGFHMPGHKRNTELMGDFLPYAIDITEIDGFDDLHHAEDILLSLERRLSDLYGAEKSWLLINGSTSGILASIMGTVREGEHVLVARNCHRSVYHGLMMSRAVPVYLYPDLCQEAPVSSFVSSRQVENALSADPEIRAVILTSPTYEGIVSDIREICEIAHSRHIPVIVDEAHGAHLGFHPAFPESAVSQGADLVVQSLHKTLPALTQTAVLHSQGSLTDADRIKKYLDIVQTSSPSYVLMGSVDVCVSMLEKQKDQLFDTYTERLRRLRKSLEQMKTLALFKPSGQEMSKIVILTGCGAGAGLTGEELAGILRQRYKIEVEMTSLSYIVAMTSIADTQEGFDRLRDALLEIDTALGAGQETGSAGKSGAEAGKNRGGDGKSVAGVGSDFSDMLCQRKKVCLPMEQAWEGPGVRIPLRQAAGRISTRFVYMYPPGIPCLVPGEEIDGRTAELLQKLMGQGVFFHGIEKDGYLHVIR